MKKLLPLLALLVLAACTNYGKKVKNGDIEVFYKEGIDQSQAQKTADFLASQIKESGAKSTGRKSFQLSKPGDTVLLKMVADKEKALQMGDDVFYLIAQQISENAFNGAPVNMQLTNSTLNPFKTLTYKKPESTENTAGEFGELLTDRTIEVYRSKDVDEVTAASIARQLNEYMHPANTISFQVSKNEAGAFVLKMVTRKDAIDAVSEDDMKDLCSRLSTGSLGGAPVTFQLTDAQFSDVMKSYEFTGGSGTPDSTGNN